MKKNKYNKLLIIFLIIFAIVSMGAVILANDTIHKSRCNIPNCSLCTLINIANRYIKNIANLLLNTLIFGLIIRLNHVIINSKHTSYKQTLVELKVIQIK